MYKLRGRTLHVFQEFYYTHMYYRIFTSRCVRMTKYVIISVHVKQSRMFVRLCVCLRVCLCVSACLCVCVCVCEHLLFSPTKCIAILFYSVPNGEDAVRKVIEAAESMNIFSLGPWMSRTWNRIPMTFGNFSKADTIITFIQECQNSIKIWNRNQNTAKIR